MARAARAQQTLRAGAHAEQPQASAGHLTLLHLHESIEHVSNLVITHTDACKKKAKPT